MIEPYLTRWNLIPTGDPFTTQAATLLPVLSGGEPAILKIFHNRDERFGGGLMEWWDGDGAARVFARSDAAVLLERATGSAFCSPQRRLAGESRYPSNGSQDGR